MTAWLDKLVKILALGLDTHVVPERQSALVVATGLAAKHRLTLGGAYLRVERSMPDSFRYLEAKRAAAGMPDFVAEADIEAQAQGWGLRHGDASLDDYPGDRRALEAMLSCTVRPLSRGNRGP